MIQGNIHNSKKSGKLRQGEAKRTGNKNVKFELLNLHELAFNDSISLKNIGDNKNAQQVFATEVNRIRKVDTIYHPEWTIDLDAITIKAQKVTQKRKRAIATKKLFQERGLFYSDFSQKLYLEDMVAGGAHYLTIHDLIRDKVGGVQFTTVEENGVQVRKVLLRPQSSFRVPTYAIFELDGTIISDATAASIVPTNIAAVSYTHLTLPTKRIV